MSIIFMKISIPLDFKTNTRPPLALGENVKMWIWCANNKLTLKIVVDLDVSVCASLEFPATKNLKLFNTLKSLFPNKSF